ncbi:MAGE protein [Xylaria sp. CBS 124048]|nr:MAGE protein [Xylaria sp. CBS 124048]
MAPPTQRRRRAGHRDEEEEEDNPHNRRQSRRAPESDNESDPSENDDDQDVDMDASAGTDGDDQLVKKLVRYALACEYARIPIKRDGIKERVLGPHGRAFRKVFDGAQEQLQKVFGMEMAELPLREKRTIKDKQKAAKRGASQASGSSRQYILISSLPTAYRAQPIMGPSRIPSTADEAAYVAFYTLIVSLITLSGGELSETRLRRYLTRLNASQNLPMDKTENILQKLIRQGYLDKVVERVEGDEDSITWCVGPRGKIEVSPHSIAQFVSEVWGNPPDDFDKKLEKSLGVRRMRQAQTRSRDRAEEDEVEPAFD